MEHGMTAIGRLGARLATTLALIALVAGCSSDGGGDGAGYVQLNAAVGGIWTGQTEISEQGTYSLLGLVAEDGRAYFLQEDGVMYWGPVTSKVSQIAATMDGAGIYGNPLWDESSSGKLTVTGTIRARDSISANSTFVTRYGGRTTSTAALTYVPMYEDDSSLDVIAGNYSDATGYFEGVLNIASSGQVFLQDPYTGCVVNGRVGIINSAYNMYDVQLAYNNCRPDFAEFNGATFTGLATYDRDRKELVALVTATVEGRPYPDILIFERM